MVQVTVLTADVINSRSSPSEDMEDLKAYVASFERSSLLSNAVMHSGDEIQLVTSGWLSDPEIVRVLRYAARPLALRVGIGLGFVAGKELQKADPREMNGLPFHRAREALYQLEEKSRPATRLVSGSEAYDTIANTLWLLLDTIQHRWTPEQWDAIAFYEKLGTYKEAAAELKIALQSVEKRCRNARWQQFRQGERTLAQLSHLLNASSPLTGLTE